MDLEMMRLYVSKLKEYIEYSERMQPIIEEKRLGILRKINDPEIRLYFNEIHISNIDSQESFITTLKKHYQRAQAQLKRLEEAKS